MSVYGTDRRRWPVRRHFRCLEVDRQFCIVADPSQLDAFETLCLPQRALPAAIEARGQSIPAPSAWRHHALRVTTSIAPTAVGRRSTSWQDPLPACSPGRPCRAPYRVRQALTTTSRRLGRALARAGTAPPLRRVGRPASARLRATAAQGNTSRAAPCRAARPAVQPLARTARPLKPCRPDAARRGLR